MRFYVTTRGVFRSATLVRSFDDNGNVLGKALGINDGQYHQSSTIWIRVRKVATVFDRTLPSVLSEGFYGELVTSFFKLPISVVIASSKFLRAVASRVATFAL